MKKMLVVAISAFMVTLGYSQLKTPTASPAGKVEQVVGLTNVSVEYSRPSTKGRNIFGNLVPFGKVWRAGANANTVISFGDDVIIDGKSLKAGEYALYVNPRPDSWDVYFYKDVNNWGLPEVWDDKKVALSVTAKPFALNYNVETFTIGINSLENNFGVIDISWEKTLVSVKFEVPTDAIATKSIEKALSGPDYNVYYEAANYYYSSGADMNQALEWVTKSIELRKDDAPFWYLRLKSLIQAKLGDKTGAIETAKKSLELSEKAGNLDYVKLNRDSISEWSK